MNEKDNPRVAFLPALLPSTASSQLAHFLDCSQLRRRLRQVGLRLGVVKRGSFVFHRFFGGTSGVPEYRFETVL